MRSLQDKVNKNSKPQKKGNFGFNVIHQLNDVQSKLMGGIKFCPKFGIMRYIHMYIELSLLKCLSSIAFFVRPASNPDEKGQLELFLGDALEYNIEPLSSRLISKYMNLTKCALSSSSSRPRHDMRNVEIADVDIKCAKFITFGDGLKDGKLNLSARQKRKIWEDFGFMPLTISSEWKTCEFKNYPVDVRIQIRMFLLIWQRYRMPRDLKHDIISRITDI